MSRDAYVAAQKRPLLTYEQARARGAKLDFSQVAVPAFTGVKNLELDLAELARWIDWSPFARRPPSGRRDRAGARCSSRMRRVPHSGFAARASTTRERTASAGAASMLSFASAAACPLDGTAMSPFGGGRSASIPPVWNSAMNLPTTAGDTPNASAVSVCEAPRITVWTMRTRTAYGT